MLRSPAVTRWGEILGRTGRGVYEDDCLGGVIVALLWLYTSVLAILVGAELNAAVEHPDEALPSPRPARK